MSTEDERAAEYRRMMTARVATTRARENAKAGSPAAAQALRDKWSAITDRDRGLPADPEDECPT